MATYELDEMQASPTIRHNTSTLESQPDTPNTPRTSTSRQNNLGVESQPRVLNPVSTPIPDFRSFRSSLREFLRDLFGKKVDDRWARSPVEIALLAASERDRWFLNTYTHIREQRNAHLNTLFDIRLSLPPSASDNSSCLPSSNVSFPSLCRSNVFSAVTNGCMDAMQILKGSSLGDCLDRLHRRLGVEHTESFTIWYTHIDIL